MPRQSAQQSRPLPRAAAARTTPATNDPASPPDAAQFPSIPAAHNLLPDLAQAAYPARRAPLRFVPSPRGTFRRPPDALLLRRAARQLLHDMQSTLLPSGVS